MTKQSGMIQYLFEVAIGRKSNPLPKSRGIALRLFNKMTMGKKGGSSYFIEEKIGPNVLKLPANHRLPWTFEKHPLYSRNLNRINSYIARDMGRPYTIIDIGANIGDSALLLRETDSKNRIVCIEGNPEYLPWLEENVKQLKGVDIVKTFVGSDGESKYGKLVSDGRGTTYIAESSAASGDAIHYTALKDIISRAGITGEIRLIKIDTDGFDCQIIKGNMETIEGFKSVLFFEYAPAWFPGGKDTQADIFDYLAQHGYGYFIFYDGVGNYLISCTAAELGTIGKEMHFHFSLGVRFGDIAAFHKDDERLFRDTIQSEKAFYQEYFKES
jgi:FkbM family methyltransferase